jgi:MFS transporter, ACS family, tartrate transporter
MSWPSWRWLLILEAAPALVLGIATYFVLPSRPAEAKFLDGEERDWVQAELQREESKKREAKLIGTLQALRILRVWHVGIIVFATNCAMYMLTFWMPQLVKSFSGRLSNTAIGFLVMIPYLAGLAGMVLVSRSSDRHLERKFHAAIPAACAGTAMALLGAPHSLAITIALLAVAVAGICSVYGPAFSLPSELLAGSAVAAGLGLASSISNAAGFVGPMQRAGSAKEREACTAGWRPPASPYLCPKPWRCSCPQGGMGTK